MDKLAEALAMPALIILAGMLWGVWHSPRTESYDPLPLWRRK